ncbi:alpha/beta hydrolase family protein [Flindersiella endophytica]
MTPLLDRSREEVASVLRGGGLASDASFGVREYRLEYCTRTPAGGPTVASGLLALPAGAPEPLTVVSYEHGTISARTDASSFQGTPEGQLAPLVFAAEGFAVVAPDYVGLGTSPDRHPFIHATTEASASIDLLQAATTAAGRLGQPLSHDLFVTGHSQGGHAAMVVGQQVQRHPGLWRLRALAPMAGPYDLSGELSAVLDPSRTDPAKAVVYLSYLLTSSDRLYDLYDDPSQAFLPPYDGTLEALFDGSHGLTDIEASLPDQPEQVFRPAVLSQIAHPHGRFAAALRANEVCEWAPAVPTRLYAGRADRDVVFAHTQSCQRHIHARGGTAEILDLGNLDHTGTAIASLPRIRDWFQTTTQHVTEWESPPGPGKPGTPAGCAAPEAPSLRLRLRDGR